MAIAKMIPVDISETSRLEILEGELAEYKKKCLRYKTENDWYRTEIETCQRDTGEYIAYLESKKEEKQQVINSLVDANKNEVEDFLARKKAKEAENQTKMEEMRKLIEELEMKLEQKQQEVNELSDAMSRRARHESEMGKLRREMQAAEAEHQQRVSELEHTLLESRMRLQREADAKIHAMESAAHEKAAKYLTDHTTTLDNENLHLSQSLRLCIARTQSLLSRKDELERESCDLAREKRVREDMVKVRLKRIVRAERARSRERERKRVGVREERMRIVKKVVEGEEERGRARGDWTDGAATVVEADVDWSDDEDEEFK